MVRGGCLAGASVEPADVLLDDWDLFMALKRFSELRELGGGGVAGSYRASFKRYTRSPCW